MAKAAALGVDFQLLDNGTGTATLTPVDAAGLATTWPTGQPIVWTSSDPAIVVTPAADGLSATFAPSVPPVLATGVTLTATGTLASGATVTGTGDPIDVVGGGPAGFKMVESAAGAPPAGGGPPG